MFRKYAGRIISLAAALLLALTIVPLNSFAVQGDSGNVVVGANPDYGITTVGGKYCGFAVDYFREMHKRTGLTFTYVEGTAPELAAKLAHGEIDVIPCVAERELNAWKAMTSAAGPSSPLELTLTDISITGKFMAVYIPADSDIDYQDYETLKGSRIGYLKEDSSKYFVNGAFIGSEVRKAEFVAYDTETQMRSDFESGKIDAVAKDCFRTWGNEMIVYQVSTDDCYFLASGSNSALLSQLDGAVGSLVTTDIGFSGELFDKYVTQFGSFRYALTSSEKHYIEKNEQIRIAYDLQSSMMDSWDKSAESLTGPTQVMLENIEKISGLKFRIVPFSTLSDCIAALQNEEVQAICGVNADGLSDYPEFSITAPYARIPMTAAGKPGSVISTRSRFAVPSTEDDISQYISVTYPGAQVLHYDNERDCINAVTAGEADIVFAEAGELVSQLNADDSGLTVLEVESALHTECFAVPNNQTELFRILGKAVSCYGDNDALIVSYSSAIGGNGRSSGANQFVEDYLAWIIAGVLLILAVVFILMCVNSFRSRRGADTDQLTGGRSRAKFFEDAKKLLKHSSPDNWAVVLFDIDKFKYVNDRLGYDEGNKMLDRLHKTVSDNMGSDEIFARLTDDNFALMIKDGSDVELRTRINDIFEEFDRRNALFVKYPVVFSAGICRLGQCANEVHKDEIDINTALDRCKIAKSTLKGTHFSSIAFYDGSIRDKALREKDYESIMPAALKKREFQCYLQPKYGLRSRNIEGAEALIRWNSPEFGFISPGDFIPIAEKNGFVVELDFFILEEVCRTMRHWIDEGKKPVVISVNQSRLHLNYDDYIWRLREIVDKYDIPYEYIELELTESVFTENAEKLLKIMHKLHEIGFKLSLDDFGSGYSSLNMLKDMPVDVVKIDKEFFSDTMNTQKGRAVISTVVDLAKNLDMDVISEGVETREQVEFLTEIHCAMVQGYYFAKPMPISDFEKLWYDDLDKIKAKKERAAAQQLRRYEAQEQAHHHVETTAPADKPEAPEKPQEAEPSREDSAAPAKPEEPSESQNA